MVLPIGDDNRDRKTTPVINYLLIALNIFAFIYWQKWGNDLQVTYAYSTVPGKILTGQDIFTLFTSMFMHGGLLHLGGNMLFLYIFGDNVEDAMGHAKYLIFYLLCGLLAGLSHVFSTFFLGQDLSIPSLGASGAISAVLAAYMRLFPGKYVHLWIFLFIIPVPAIIAVGLWFALQVISGLGMLGGKEAGGVAYAAHIGGFIFGLLLTGSFAKGYLSRKKAYKNR
jgi:membrane associated rhomboid family serine protease